MSLPGIGQPFVEGSVRTALGQVPRVSTQLTWRDYWGAFKARWGVGRMKYTVEPGLYAVGEPDPDSHVLVSANYKLSFDALRKCLAGRSFWILVLDTKGINVWCAAGKGTFGTQELVERIESTGLSEIVSHRRLILPQLAGPGVAAHEVKKFSGFKVVYGPIKARDLPTFIDSGCEATPLMRRKTFTLLERLVLVPVELVGLRKAVAIILPLFLLLGGLGGPGPFWANVWNYGLFAVFALLTGVLAGTVLTPILLPWLPGRAFSTKGLWAGLAFWVVLALFRADVWTHWPGRLEVLAWLFIVPAVSAYLAMNFTGASTYTSLSGVKKEMRVAVPLQVVSTVIGVVLWFGSRLSA